MTENIQGRRFLTDESEIEKWLNLHKISGYEIVDGKVNVIGNVNLSYQKLNSFPIRFGIIKGSFECNNNQLESLEGAPETVEGDFNCGLNFLHHLQGSPKKITGNFNCGANTLKTLEGCTQDIGGSLFCDNNRLVSLKGCPETIEALMCYDNFLENLQGISQFIKKDWDISNNRLKNIEGFPQVGGTIMLGGNLKLSQEVQEIESFQAYEKYMLKGKLEEDLDKRFKVMKRKI